MFVMMISTSAWYFQKTFEQVFLFCIFLMLISLSFLTMGHCNLPNLQGFTKSTVIGKDFTNYNKSYCNLLNVSLMLLCMLAKWKLISS